MGVLECELLCFMWLRMVNLLMFFLCVIWLLGESCLSIECRLVFIVCGCSVGISRCIDISVLCLK